MPTQHPRTDEDRGVESRLSRLETMIEGLAEDVHGLAHSLKTMAAPNWSTWIGFAGILLTIIGMVAGAVFIGYSTWQSRMEQGLSNLLTRALDLEYKRGVSETEIAELRTVAKKLDIDLQREMRDVNAKTEAELHALDIRLQDEVRRTASVGAEDRVATKEAIREAREYQNTTRGLNAAQEERMRAIERQLFKEQK